MAEKVSHNTHSLLKGVKGRLDTGQERCNTEGKSKYFVVFGGHGCFCPVILCAHVKTQHL